MEPETTAIKNSGDPETKRMRHRYTVLPEQGITHLQISRNWDATDFIGVMEKIHADPRVPSQQHVVIDLGALVKPLTDEDLVRTAEYIRIIEGMRSPSRWAFISLNQQVRKTLEHLNTLTRDGQVEMDHFAFLDSGLRWLQNSPSRRISPDPEPLQAALAS